MKIQKQKEVYVFKIDEEILNELINNCENQLLNVVPKEFKYPKIEDKNIQDFNSYSPKILKENKELLDKLNNQANVYAIHIKETENSNWKVVYIGQRKSKNLRSRIVQHLVKKSSSTGSKLNEIINIVKEGGNIGISFILVKPEPLRMYVEETLIQRHSENLNWNIHK